MRAERPKMQNGKPNWWEFDSFRLEIEDGGRLCKDGREIHLKPKEVEVLRMLVGAAGTVVSRKEMLEKVWADTFVEEGNINYTISCIRKKLRKHGSKDTEFIRTVPKTGYRFVAPVAGIVVENPDIAFAPAPASGDFSRARLLILAFVSVFLVAGFSVWLQIDRDSGLSSVPVGERSFRSIAVLPPHPLAAEKDGSGERLARLSVADAISSTIADWNVIAVRPITATLRFEDGDKDELAFARDLDADAVLASTYLKQGKQIRLNFRLLDARDGAVVWSDTVDVIDAGVIRLQESVSGEVGRKLAKALGVEAADVRTARLTENEDAYELYLRGKYFLNNRKFEKTSAVDLFRQATKLDPDFAEAYVGIAEWLAFKENPGEELNSSLQKAITLDPTLADAWAISGFVKMFNEWDWGGAEADLERSLELEPNNVKARQWYGTYLTLRGDFEGARKQLNIALEQDPSSMFVRTDLAELLYFEHRFDEAEAAARDLAVMEPNHKSAYMLLAKISFLTSKDKKFIENIMAYLGPGNQLAVRLRGRGATEDLAVFAETYYRLVGCSEEGSVPALPCAEMLHISGATEEAIEYLNFAAEEEIFLLPFISVDPFWDAVRDQPRFQRLVERMALQRRDDLVASR